MVFTCNECARPLTPKGLNATCLCKECKFYFCMDEGYISNQERIIDIIRGAKEGIITDFLCYQCEAKQNISRDRSGRKSNAELKEELTKKQDKKLANVEEEAKEKIEGERETKKKQIENFAKSAEERAKARGEESERIKKMMETEKKELIEGNEKIKGELEQEREKETQGIKKQLEESAKIEKERKQAEILKKNQDHSNYLIIPNRGGIKSMPIIGFSGKIEPCNGYLDFWKDNESMATDIYMSFYYEVSHIEQGQDYNLEQTKGSMRNYCLECSRKIFERWGMALNNSAMIEAMKTQQRIKELTKPK